jgi:hypothetical protein
LVPGAARRTTPRPSDALPTGPHEAARLRTEEAGFDLHLTKGQPLDPLLEALAEVARRKR